MSKTKSAFFCQNCGHETPKWLGKCPSCQEWNTFVEEILEKTTKHVVSFSKDTKASKPLLIQDVEHSEENRIFLQDFELNRVMGGGIVLGSISLLGGDPGIGKSTLLLQLAIKERLKVLYVSGEESDQQIRMRAERLGLENDQCYLLTETNLQQILIQANEVQPQLLVIDSIQTLHTNSIESSPGSVAQVRECTANLLRFAKQTNIPVFLIGHITKDGTIAGPKVLEHMVDTVLQFEGDRHHIYRLLRSIKNRFGSTNELGIYSMQGHGLFPVENPSEVLVSGNDSLSGVAVASMVDGIRPILIEVQALVSSAAYGTPQRSSNGYDAKRLNMLLAVLEKRCSFRLASKDVFLNIAGGIKVDDPAVDLAVIIAVLSSNADIPVSRSYTFAAEVGLSGEIRPVNRIETRISEAQKLGYTHIYISSYNKGVKPKDYGIEVIQAKKIEEIVKSVFG